jgi:hypothetical protein
LGPFHLKFGEGKAGAMWGGLFIQILPCSPLYRNIPNEWVEGQKKIQSLYTLKNSRSFSKAFLGRGTSINWLQLGWSCALNQLGNVTARPIVPPP